MMLDALGETRAVRAAIDQAAAVLRHAFATDRAATSCRSGLGGFARGRRGWSQGSSGTGAASTAARAGHDAHAALVARGKDGPKGWGAMSRCARSDVPAG